MTKAIVLCYKLIALCCTNFRYNQVFIDFLQVLWNQTSRSLSNKFTDYHYVTSIISLVRRQINPDFIDISIYVTAKRSPFFLLL